MSMDRYTYFWTLIIIAMAIFFIGMYKHVVEKVCYVLWVNQQDQQHGGRAARPGPPWRSLLRTLVREALLQWRITDRSSFLWSRHFLIFAGFVLLFVLDGFYALTTKYYPIAFFQQGAGRGWLKLGLESMGCVLLLGLSAGIAHRLLYAGRERGLIDLTVLLLLWLVVVSGFWTESLRLVVEPADPHRAFSFVASRAALLLADGCLPWQQLYAASWIVHATITAVFFAYIPYSKLIHIMVVPVGRSITMTEGFVQHKREQISERLL